MSNDIPRRTRLDLMTPAEVAIIDAIRAIETAGCDVRLTKAQNLLSEARELVADVVDGVAPPNGVAAGDASKETP